MSQWFNFYKERLNKRYALHIRTKYNEFVGLIEDEIDSDTVLIEVGCGIGSISYELATRNTSGRFILTDISNDMLYLTAQNAENYGVRKNISLYQCNAITNIAAPSNLLRNKRKVIHSHGLLEHFTNEQIKSCIQSQKRLANTLIHYVPSFKYKEPSFGDERLMTAEEWNQICNPTQIIEFNDGYDLILVWR